MKKNKFSFIGFIIVTLMYSCNNDIKVILTKDSLEKKIGLNEKKIFYRSRIELVSVCMKSIPSLSVDSVYVKEGMGKLRGFQYNIESANFGIAEIDTMQDGINIINFYNQLDVSVDLVKKPSFSVYYTKKGNSFTSFNNLTYEFKYFTSAAKDVPVGVILN
jgi:hypothetical protein